MSDPQTPPEPGTREHILIWLAGKDREGTYDWGSYSLCACGTYARECLGKANFAWITIPGPLCELNRMALGLKTFGALYERVRERWAA